jgi:uncharacterized phage protein gp47/JayE
MLSTDPSGISPNFVQYGDLITPSTISRTAVGVISSNTTTAYDPTTGQQVITTYNNTQTTNYNSVDIPSSALNGAQQFYAMLSTVVQDQPTNAIFESQQNGPLLCGFVNLKLTNPTDFLALQRREDITARLITQMTRYYPNLDLTPRSEIRDLMVDPVSIEIANMSVREWFARMSQSVSAICQVDDSNDDGFSDAFDASPVKQQLSRAFNLSPSDTQTLIDNQFDILGEQAGLVRNSSSPSVVTLTFYTYVKPVASVAFTQGTICSTLPDTQTPSLNFITTGSATVNISAVNSFYDPINGWWSVTVPASCQSSGSTTNVGAGTIQKVSSGTPAGWNVINLAASAFGQDDEINSAFAARIMNRMVTGVDSGTRNGYLTTALATPGIVSASVVAAGDTEMLRDWDSLRQKHVYGCVDIYAQGTTSSEQNEIISYTYGNSGTFGSLSSYLTLNLTSNPTTLGSNSLIVFQVVGFNTLEYPLYQGLQLAVSRQSSSIIYYLGLTNAQFDNTNGYILVSPTDMAYQIVGDSFTQTPTPAMFSGVAVNNQQLLAKLGSTATYQLISRYHSPLSLTPDLQPITSVNSVTGQPNLTGSVNSSIITLVHTSDFLLNGSSNKAGDEVQVSATASASTTATVTASLGNYVTVDTNMDVPLISGAPGAMLSVLSSDQSESYGWGVDYTTASTGVYHSYGIQPKQVTCEVTNILISGGVLTATCNNRFGVNAPVTFNDLTGASFLSGQTVVVSGSDTLSFTAPYQYNDYPSTPDTGTVVGYTILDGQQLLVSYNKFQLMENLNFASGEPQQLNGTIPSTLSNQGFVYNTWLPESYGRTDLTLDGWGGNYTTDVNGAVTGLDLSTSTGLVEALVPRTSRYIKVTYNGKVMKEGSDFILTVDSVSGTASISRNVSNVANIPDGGSVLVSYFYTEAFTVSTQYPAFVESLVGALSNTKHAAADVLVKAKISNPVDITMSIVLESNASSDTLDPIIRTTIDLVLDNASGTLYQSEIVRQVKAITGVQSVVLPLVKCAKSDGAYNVGSIIPTNTSWTALASDPAIIAERLVTPANSYITSTPVLTDSTIPSGGTANAFVGLLFQGQSYTRCMSIQEFLNLASSPVDSTQSGFFYICGGNDPLVVNPSATTDYLSYSYAGKVILCVPQDVKNPSINSYTVTYQVWGEGSAGDVTMSSTEYFSPGRITLNYLSN